MTVKDTFTSMADHLRSEYGVDGLITTEQLKTGINGLHVQNLLDEGQSYTKNVDDRPKPVLGLTVEKWNKELLGKTITISCDIEYSGFAHDNNQQNRLGFEIEVDAKDGTYSYYGVWSWPSSANGKQHLAKTYTIDKREVRVINPRLYDMISSDELRITNVKVVINPMS